MGWPTTTTSRLGTLVAYAGTSFKAEINRSDDLRAALSLPLAGAF